MIQTSERASESVAGEEKREKISLLEFSVSQPFSLDSLPYPNMLNKLATCLDVFASGFP